MQVRWACMFDTSRRIVGQACKADSRGLRAQLVADTPPAPPTHIIMLHRTPRRPPSPYCTVRAWAVDPRNSLIMSVLHPNSQHACMCLAVLHSTVPCFAVLHYIVQCSAVLQSTVPCLAVLHSTVPCSAVLHSTVLGLFYAVPFLGFCAAWAIFRVLCCVGFATYCPSCCATCYTTCCTT